MAQCKECRSILLNYELVFCEQCLRAKAKERVIYSLKVFDFTLEQLHRIEEIINE